MGRMSGLERGMQTSLTNFLNEHWWFGIPSANPKSYYIDTILGQARHIQHGRQGISTAIYIEQIYFLTGFSVDSAKGVMRKSELTFVAGAPRANHTGAVLLLRKDNVYRLMPEFILWGEELASSFGYSVAVADLNRDG